MSQGAGGVLSIAASASASTIAAGFIVGPTGAGKTAIAVEVAARLGAEIVNADSRQLYRGMDIGTAKPSRPEMRRVPHHLIDACEVDQPIDVARFAEMGRAAIAEVASSGRPVLVVGGSGLYLRVLRDGIFAGPAASQAVRLHLIAEAERNGDQSLHERLVSVDPAAASRISVNDRVRIVRALEVFELTGMRLSEHHARHRFATAAYRTLTIGLTFSREALYAQIDARFDAMIEAGLIAELRALLDKGYDADAPPLRNTIGYREIAAHLRGESSLEAAIELAKRRSRQLAKRQLTWFRARSEIEWMDPSAGPGPVYARFREFFG